MSKTKSDLPKITPSNTKKEMLEAYNTLAARLEEQARQELKPEKTREEKQAKEAVTAADTLTAEGIASHIDSIKAAIAGELGNIAEKVESQAQTYRKIKDAIAAKERELCELFEIEKSAFSLAALLEANRQQKKEFEEVMARRRHELDEEIQATRVRWEKEKTTYVESVKEQKKEDDKRRKREDEEYHYLFNREKEQQRHALEDELAQLGKKLAEEQEEYDRKVAAKDYELQEREDTVAAREKRLDELQKSVDSFPKELDTAVKKVAAETTEKLTAAAAKNEELLMKTLEGEKNVLAAKIQALEQMVAEQRKQLENLSGQLEKAYGNVQDIAVKAVAGAHDRQQPDSGSRRWNTSEQIK